MFGNIGGAELVLIIFAAMIFTGLFKVVPFWFIFKKAGFHPALSLLIMVPLADLIMRFFLAFAEWPALKRSDS